MNKVNKSSEVFIKYLLSYVITMLLPLLILCILVYFYFINTMKQEAIYNNLNHLNTINKVIENEFNQLDRIANQLHLNPNFRPFEFGENPYKVILIKKELMNYNASNTFFDEMFVYFLDDKYIYSSSSSYEVSMFIDSMYNFQKWEKDEFLYDINNIKTSVIRPLENVGVYKSYIKKYITYLTQLGTMHSETYGTVMFVISEETINRLIGDIFKEYSANTVILNKNNEIIASINQIENLNSDDYVKTLEDIKKNNIKSIKLNGNEYIVSYLEAENIEFTYLTFVSSNDVMKDVTRANMIFLISIVIIVIIGAFIIFWLMKINYDPIKKLKTYVENKVNKPNNNTNEIETVIEGINSLSLQKMKLDNRVKNSKSALKDYIILNILNNNITDIKELNKKSKEIGIEFTKSKHLVVVFYLDLKDNKKESNLLNAKKIINDIEKNSQDGIETYGKESLDNSRMVFIISFDVGREDLIRGQIEKYKEYFCKQNISPTVGVGSICDNITKISKSYLEAVTAIDYRFIKGKNSIIYYSEVRHMDFELKKYPYELLDKLKISIQQEEISQMEEITDGIISYINNANVPLSISRFIAFDIINIAIKTTYEESKKTKSTTFEYPDVFSLTEFDTVEESVNIVRSISRNLCEIKRKNEETKNKILIQKINKHIVSNYTDYNLSIQSIAEKFNMSMPGISQYYKNQTGENISDYITNLRIEKAKKLLEKSNETVKDIVKDVGYLDVSSFIRKFKQIVGTTPGKYRDYKK